MNCASQLVIMTTAMQMAVSFAAPCPVAMPAFCRITTANAVSPYTVHLTSVTPFITFAVTSVGIINDCACDDTKENTCGEAAIATSSFSGGNACGAYPEGEYSCDECCIEFFHGCFPKFGFCFLIDHPPVRGTEDICSIQSSWFHLTETYLNDR